MLTATESEALALEESLIRQHEPPLNVMLPHYRFLRVTMGEAFPRFQLAREMVPGDGSLYFGPYPDREALETLFTVLLPLFRIRGDSSRCPWDGLLPRPACYRLDFGWCSGPCAGVVDRAQYRGDAEGLCELLAGGQDDFFRRLLSEMETRLAAVGEECLLMDAQASERRLRMKCAAVELRFEEAASLRDELAVMERLHAGARARIRRLEKQRIGLRRLAEAKEVVQPGLPDADVWAVSAEAGVVSLVVLPFREGRAGQPYRASGTAAELAKSLRAYYRKRSTPPPRVVFVSSGSKHRTVDLATLVRNLWPESPVLFESGDDSETWSAAAALAVRNLNI
jgi:excinuclease UvrABC nuclease subunit